MLIYEKKDGKVKALLEREREREMARCEARRDS